MKIPFITEFTHYFKTFHLYAGFKLYILYFVIFFAGITEGFGITMLLPILNYDESRNIDDSYTQLIYSGLESLGISLSLTSLLTILFIAFMLKGFFLFFQESLVSYILSSLIKKIRIELCSLYEAMRYEYYINTNIGQLNNLITTETERAVGGMSIFCRLIAGVLFIIVYISAAVIINWKITILVLLICIFLFAMLRGLSTAIRKLSTLVSNTNAELQSLTLQFIYNFKYLKATYGFSKIFEQITNKIEENCYYRFRSGMFSAIPASMIEPITVIFLSGLIFYQVGYKGRSMAEIMILLLFFYKAFTRIFRLQSDWQKFNLKTGGVEIVEKTQKSLLTQREATGGRSINDFNKGIELTNIDYSYNDKQVLFNINITIPKNRSIGIVGESGAGKTTLFDLLTGLLIPQTGSITIDDIDYNVLDIQSLRMLTGYVTQEAIVFNDTIANNISLWSCDLDDAKCINRIKEAAKMANCFDFIDKTEEGFRTSIGDRGVKLSGGQRQRLAIARELFKEPKIMIFDEATSALDTESEIMIQESINSMKGKCTVVIIAHRLSTVKQCDYIYVLKEGRIREQGTFFDLSSDSDSQFYRMCQAQKL